MDLASNFRMMSRYNQRMNQQLILVCQQLTEEQLQQSTQAFFPTVMSHWNHLLFADLIMLRRLVNSGIYPLESNVMSSLPIATSVDDTFVDTLEQLQPLRQKIDKILIEMVDSFDSVICQKTVRYNTTEGTVLKKTVAEFCQHLFNHQTHHRGQLTCILSQFGLDFGNTDLPVIVPEGTNLSV